MYLTIGVVAESPSTVSADIEIGMYLLPSYIFFFSISS